MFCNCLCVSAYWEEVNAWMCAVCKLRINFDLSNFNRLFGTQPKTNAFLNKLINCNLLCARYVISDL